MRIGGQSECIVFFIGMLIFLGAIGVVADEGDTMVSVNPSSQTISGGNTFNVNVSCVPSQPIKAFEFRLVFDSSLLKVNSVTEGDIFDGYTTFFNNGTIDNSAGNIVDIYGLIVGSGNVSDPGTLVTISFTAKDKSGTSSLDINGVGITDETGYISVAVSDGSVAVKGTGGGGSPSGGGFVPPVVEEEDDENTAPEPPNRPSGSTFIEIGVEYQYSSSTFDVDGDQIRYKFDWGDGHSNWSEFVASNNSLAMSHSWSSVSTYKVRVIAQDENGLNSSWSLPLNVTVSQAGLEDEIPVADIAVPSNLSTNKTIVFDASGSFDEDGVIVSYQWDFGDGMNSSGITPSHVYKNPGEYNVTLIVTDNDGNTFSKSIMVTVTSEIEDESEDKQSIFPFNLGTVIFGCAIILICLAVFFRGNLKSFWSAHGVHLSLHAGVLDTKSKIKRIDAKIEKIKKMNNKIR
ncbi:MAG: PKD domain-containing protein [Petrotogales bacterium]